jgi:uncharacterized protein (TIGR02996 family)
VDPALLVSSMWLSGDPVLGAATVLPGRIQALEHSRSSPSSVDPLALLRGRVPSVDAGDPLLPLALRRLLGWDVHRVGMLFERTPDAERADELARFAWGFVGLLVEAACTPARRAGGPVEQELLDAIAAAPTDPGPRLVYADWCEERGLERPAFAREELLAAVREAFARGEPPLDRLYLAVAAARLGDPLGVDVLAAALAEALAGSSIQHRILSALGDLGLAAAPAAEALARLAATPPGGLHSVALLASLAPDEPGWAARLVAELPGYVRLLREHVETFEQGLITRFEIEPWLETLRRSLSALEAGPARAGGLQSVAAEVAALLADGAPSSLSFAREIATCRRLQGGA